jgi:hypothetical protein
MLEKLISQDLAYEYITTTDDRIKMIDTILEEL